jgi:MiaB-like tRNA modifying enzyme
MFVKIYIETYGCAANQADENVIRTVLKKEKFVKNEKEADLVLVLTCGVKGSTENKILARLEELRGKCVIVGGCLPKILKLQKTFPEFSLIGPDQIADIAEVIGRVAAGETVVELSEKKCNHIVADVKNEVQAIAICSGCLSQCAYCATQLAKGKLKSFTVKEIVASVKTAVENGAKKILLTAQDTGAYGQDIGSDLPELLRAVVEIPGSFEVRIGMMNPKYAFKFAEELIEVYKNLKIIKFVHVPVQAGSNAVLKKMNRNYTVEEFEKLVSKLRKGIPQLVFSTDVICGFPEETEAQFDETVALIKRIKPDVLNISKFYPRPGTAAMKMKLLHTKVVKERSKKLAEVFRTLRFNK